MTSYELNALAGAIRETEAISRLISAAPDMLRALKLALDDFGPDCVGETIDAMRDAVAKAEGRAQ